MKYLILSTLSIFLFIQESNSQVIDNIKDASDRHSSQSSNSDDSYVDDSYSDDTYYDDDSYFYDDSYDDDDNIYMPDFFNSGPDIVYWIERKRADTTYKFGALNILYRRTTNSGQVAISTPEIQFKYGGYFGSIRINQLIEEGAKEEDRYATTDVQFLGFQSNPKNILTMNLSFGLMAEQYSGNVFAEGVVGFRLRPIPVFAIAWEGRLAGDDISVVRSENTLSAQYSVVRKPTFEVTTDVFTTSSLYYQQVSVKGFGFGVGLRF